MRRLFTCAMFALLTASCHEAMAQLSDSRQTRADGNLDPRAGAPVKFGQGTISSRAIPSANPAPPPAAPPQQSSGGQNPDRDQHGHSHHGGGQSGSGHHGHWQGGGFPWVWPVPVGPVYPYFSTPTFFGYNPAYDYSFAPYNSSASYNAVPINTAPIVLPGPAASPGSAIKNTNADQKARAGRFIGFGDASFMKQKYLAAIGRYKTAIETAPDMPEGYFRQGFAHVGLGQYESAAKAFRRGLLVQSSWRGASFRLDLLYGAGGNSIKVFHLENLAQAVEANPFDADLLLVLGIELLFDGQVDRAELCFARVAQLGGDSQRLLVDLMPPPKPAGTVTVPVKATGKISF